MKRWAILVAGLYLLILIVLTVPAILLAFATKISVTEAVKSYSVWAYWVWLAVMVISQLALLAVPVRVASRRPMTRGALWPTILAAGLMIGALAVGAVYSVAEFLLRDKGPDSWIAWGGIGVGLVTWGVWAVIFHRAGRSEAPSDVVTRQCRLLLKGSILELLIAVPTHIVARYRDYCCAGFMTFVGLTMGAAVMLFAYGPAVFYLFVERWNRLHPRTGSAPLLPER
jgi:hypothetical protein